MNGNNNASVIVVTLIMIMGITFSLLFYFTPALSDDLEYLLPYKNSLGEISFSFNTFLEQFIQEWHENNIRLVNMLFPIMATTLPRWIICALSGVMVVIFLTLVIKLSNISLSRILPATIMVAMIVLILPWWDSIAVMDYAFNYVWGSAIGLSFVYVFFNKKSKQDNLFFPLILSLFTGLTHEGLSIPLVCGLLMYIVFNIRQVSKKQWLMLLLLVIGLMLLMTAEGKTARSEPTFNRSLNTWIFRLVYHNPMLIILCFVAIIAWWRNGIKFIAEILHKPLLCYIIASIIVYLISVSVFLTARVAWYGTLFSIIAIFNIWNDYIAKDKFGVSYKAGLYSIIIAIILIAHMVVTDVYAYKVREQTRYITKEYVKEPEKTIYYDFIDEQTVPIFALGKVKASNWTYDWELKCFSRYYGNENQPIKVVPVSVLDFDESKAVKLKGNNPFYIYKNHVMASVASIKENDVFMLDFYALTDRIAYPHKVRFTAENGKEYYYCYIFFYELQYYIDRLKSVDKVEN